MPSSSTAAPRIRTLAVLLVAVSLLSGGCARNFTEFMDTLGSMVGVCDSNGRIPEAEQDPPPPARKPAATQRTAPPQSGTTKPENGGTKPPAGVSGRILADSVQRYFGVRYVWGGTTPKGFDCSGLVYYVCKQHGLILPRTSKEQANAGRAVARGNLRPGDLVFFGRTSSGPVDHVGIYIGSDTYVHAPNPELPVMKTRLSDNSFVKDGVRHIFQGKYVTARRVAE